MRNNDIERFSKKLEIKRYSRSTVSTYSSFLRLFERAFKIKDWENLKNRDLLNFSYQFISEKEFSNSSQKQLLSALKLFYSEVHKRDVNLDSLRPRNAGRINPVILSRVEVKRLLSGTKNTKHRAILTTIYSLGLRSGELINLRIKDLDGDRNLIQIKDAKGRKDRIVMFPSKLKALLRTYYLEFRPKEFLFEGQSGGAYSQSSARNILKNQLKRAKISKHITLHGLRHSFATHLLEDGVSIAHIQKLLGHNDIKTTLIYTHVAKSSILNIKSPLDTM